jgi:hypothetical protein
MRIEEFISTYLPVEVDKINERKFERNKPGRQALMSKVLDNMGKEYAVGEKIVGRETSPGKTAKILQEAFSSQKNFAKCFVAPKKTPQPRFIHRSRKD